MTYVFEFPKPEKLPAISCKTVDERFDHDDWLGDALSENMELVRDLRGMLPASGRKSETRREAQITEAAAMALIEALEAYMKDD